MGDIRWIYTGRARGNLTVEIVVTVVAGIIARRLRRTLALRAGGALSRGESVADDRAGVTKGKRSVSISKSAPTNNSISKYGCQNTHSPEVSTESTRLLQRLGKHFVLADVVVGHRTAGKLHRFLEMVARNFRFVPMYVEP